MWTPPEKVRHVRPVMPVPTAQGAASSKLFSPLKLASGLELSSRTWVPAMVPWRATDDGFVSPRVLAWYGRFAEGQPGAIVVEATGIRDVPSGPLLRIGHERFIPGLAELCKVVHERSQGQTKLFIQLIDFLAIKRRPEKAKFLGRFLEITPALRGRLGMASEPDQVIRDALMGLDEWALKEVLDPRDYESLTMGYRERVTDQHLAHIQSLPQVLPKLFADAAERAQTAGFDGVELHYAHAYTMASFLSATNDRTDGYGGCRASRARLPIEVFATVRQRVGRKFTVGARFLCDEIVDEGSRVDDAIHYAVVFAQVGMDFLSLSTGGRFEDAKTPKVGEAAYPYTGPSGYECMPTTISDAVGPFGRNLNKQALIRQAVRDAGLDTPIVVAGGICEFAQAEAALQAGQGDIIASARQTLADPDWFRKVRLGFGDSVRRCKYTNYCEALDQKHKEVTCQLWDREGISLDEPRSLDGRRRLVAPPWIAPTSVVDPVDVLADVRSKP